MATDLEALIKRAISKKQGNKEFALFFFDDDDVCQWGAEIGNPSGHVMLGEVEGEFSSQAVSPTAAVIVLLELMAEKYGD